MTEDLSARRQRLGAEMNAASERVRAADLRLAQAEEVLDAAYEEFDPVVDLDSRFLAAQARYIEVCRSYTEAGEVRDAYRAIARVRREIAAAAVTDYLQSVLDARAEAFAAVEILSAVKQEFERLQSEELRQLRAGISLSKEPVSDAIVARRTAPSQVTATRPAAQAIEAEARRRGIVRLVHYTRLENLPTILKHGLLPRANIEGKARFKVSFNDSVRADRRLDCSCLSVQKINYLMFWEHSRYRFPQAEWCIVGFDSSIIWKQSCLFCETNAASAGAVGRALEYGWSGEGLARMFNDPVPTRRGVVSRSALMPGGLPTNETSDPQAEVLVEGRIAPELIRAVTFRRQDDRRGLEEYLTNARVDYRIDHSQFGPRKDFSFWRRLSPI